MCSLPYLEQVGERCKERAISFDSLLRFASHGHPTVCPMHVFLHPSLFHFYFFSFFIWQKCEFHTFIFIHFFLFNLFKGYYNILSSCFFTFVLQSQVKFIYFFQKKVELFRLINIVFGNIFFCQ